MTDPKPIEMKRIGSDGPSRFEIHLNGVSRGDVYSTYGDAKKAISFVIADFRSKGVRPFGKNFTYNIDEVGILEIVKTGMLYGIGLYEN